MSKTALYVAGTIFGLVAVVHIYRLLDHFNLVVGTTQVPTWANIVGAIVAAGLSYWMFCSACSKCEK